MISRWEVLVGRFKEVGAMQFEVDGEFGIYRRERVYKATIGTPIRLPVHIGGNLKEFEVRYIRVECQRDGEHKTWYVAHIHVGGPVLKKDGEHSLINRWDEWGRDQSTWPKWAVPAANEFLAELEQERTADQVVTR